MDRRRALFRAGLLILLLSAVPARSGGEEGALSLRVETDAAPLRIGEIWTLTIYVDHPVPAEVAIDLPDLPPYLSLERLRVLPWTGEDGSRGSKVECDLLPRYGGEGEIPPLGIRAPGRRGSSPPISAAVRGLESPRPPVLTWILPPLPPRSGEAFEVWLAGASGEADYRPLPPPNALVETLPPEGFPAASSGEGPQERRPLLGLRVTPLEGSSVTLEPFPLRLEGWTLQSPRLELALLPALPPAEPPRGAAPAPSLPAPAETPPEAPWPPEGGIPGGAAGRALERGRSLWAAGRRAEALALIRAAERDLITGPRLRPLRRALEAALGLDAPADEAWRPRILLFAGALTGALAALILLAGGRGAGGVTFFRFRGYRIIVLLSVIMTAGCLWGSFAPARRPYGVALATWALAAPERGSSPVFSLREGERVRVRAGADSWVYAETGGGDSAPGQRGWIPAGDLILY
ncbi:MAG: hypothetical protein LBQ35_03925 [Spirochaetaceae bacterium]|nr:hypothetical protein [Spirochaetaceae bacterium]